MAFLLKAMCLAVITAVLIPSPAESVLTCGAVLNYLKPCFPYVLQNAPLSKYCCPSLSNLKAAAATTADRQAVCNCFKALASGYTGNPAGPLAKATTLPRTCGIQLPYKPSYNFNCKTVK